MNLFRRLHDRVEPPGLEWKILRRLPRYFVAATTAPLIVAAGARLLLGNGSSAAVSKQIMSIDIFCAAVGVASWIALLTLGIGCIVVHIMKGPGYVADSYEVPHSDRPRRPAERD